MVVGASGRCKRNVVPRPTSDVNHRAMVVLDDHGMPLASPCPCPGHGLGGEKRLEDPAMQFRRDARAGVATSRPPRRLDARPDVIVPRFSPRVFRASPIACAALRAG